MGDHYNNTEAKAICIAFKVIVFELYIINRKWKNFFVYKTVENDFIQMVAYINNIYILHYKNIKVILDKSS